MPRLLRCVRVLCIGTACLILGGCGGGGSGSDSSPGSTPVTTSTNPSFTISVSPATVTLAEGGASQPVQVSATAEGGFAGLVSVSASSLPSGVTVSPSTLSVTPGSPMTLNFSASSTAGISQQSITVNATSGTLTATASLQLNISGNAVPDPFHQIGGSMVHGFYDESRQLLFATNFELNEVDVISGQTFSVQARVPVPQPWGIDQMADGNTLVIGTKAQDIVTLDENTLAVTEHPFSAAATFALFFPNVVAMANGKVLIIGQEQGIESDNIQDGGQYLCEWNSNANTFSQLEPTSSNPSWETDSLARSSDHNWAVFSADQFYLYSSQSDSLTSVALSTVNPPENEYGVRGYAVNANGTEIAVASADQVTFLNRSLAPIGSTSLPSAFQGVPTSFQDGRTSVQFSKDGQKLFLQYDLPVTIEEINATTFSALGYLSGTVIPDSDNFERLLATDSNGNAYVGINGGLRIVDLAQPPVPNSTGPLNPYPCPTLDVVLPLNTPQQMQLTNTYKSLSVYIGGQPAPLMNGGTEINIPASATPGPADIVCIDIYGDTSVVADGVTYGVDPLTFSANLLPPMGNPNAYIFGFGIYASPFGANPSVTIGGQSALKVTTFGNAGSGDIGIGAIEGMAIQVPNGVSGEPANVAVNNSLGSGALSIGATYYQSPTILPISGLLQLTFDNQRNRLYALTTTQVDVLDATTRQWRSPLVFPAGAANGVYTAMALTPDASKLVISGMAGSSPQVIVLDPDNASSASVLTYSGTQSVSLSGSIAITEFNTVIMPSSNGLSGLVLDLSTSTFSPVRLGSIQVVRASSDGSHIYGAELNESGGNVFSIDPSAYTLQSEQFGQMFWTDLAVSPDGTQFAAVDAPPATAGDDIGFFDSGLHYLNTNVYPDGSSPDDSGVLGATFSPGGMVLVMPLGDSIEFWDATKGTLRARLMTPEELKKLVYPEGSVAPVVAIDPAGQTIYAISASGLTVLTLPEPLDQIPAVAWPESRPSGNMRARANAPA